MFGSIGQALQHDPNNINDLGGADTVFCLSENLWITSTGSPESTMQPYLVKRSVWWSVIKWFDFVAPWSGMNEFVSTTDLPSDWSLPILNVLRVSEQYLLNVLWVPGGSEIPTVVMCSLFTPLDGCDRRHMFRKFRRPKSERGTSEANSWNWEHLPNRSACFRLFQLLRKGLTGRFRYLRM